MKLKLSELHPNPYKKWISEGKLNQEQVNKLLSNLEELGHMGSIPVVTRKNKYYLVSHHHRVEALKQLHGKDYEVEVTLHDYTDSQLFRGMVVENLTQRAGEFREEMENAVATEKYLNENLGELKDLRSDRQTLSVTSHGKGEKFKKEYQNKACSEDIARWLDPGEKVIMKSKVKDLLSVAHNLSPVLIEEVKRTHSGSASKRGEILSQTQAVMLSRIDDHEEQKDLAVAFKESREPRVRVQVALMAEYKKAPEGLKADIRSRKVDIADVGFYTQVGGKTDTSFIPDLPSQMKQFARDIGKLETQVAFFSKVVRDKRFAKQYGLLRSKQRKTFRTSFVSLRERIKSCSKNIEKLATELPDSLLKE